VAVWKSFMDLVHLIGALGCLALTGGFAADGEPARAVFYGLLTMAFAVALAHRRTRDRVVDLRGTRAERPAPLGRTARPR
jgi:hypothetical protein